MVSGYEVAVDCAFAFDSSGWTSDATLIADAELTYVVDASLVPRRLCCCSGVDSEWGT